MPAAAQPRSPFTHPTRHASTLSPSPISQHRHSSSSTTSTTTSHSNTNTRKEKRQETTSAMSSSSSSTSSSSSRGVSPRQHVVRLKNTSQDPATKTTTTIAGEGKAQPTPLATFTVTGRDRPAPVRPIPHHTLNPAAKPFQLPAEHFLSHASSEPSQSLLRSSPSPPTSQSAGTLGHLFSPAQPAFMGPHHTTTTTTTSTSASAYTATWNANAHRFTLGSNAHNMATAATATTTPPSVGSAMQALPHSGTLLLHEHHHNPVSSAPFMHTPHSAPQQIHRYVDGAGYHPNDTTTNNTTTPSVVMMAGGGGGNTGAAQLAVPDVLYTHAMLPGHLVRTAATVIGGSDGAGTPSSANNYYYDPANALRMRGELHATPVTQGTTTNTNALPSALEEAQMQAQLMEHIRTTYFRPKNNQTTSDRNKEGTTADNTSSQPWHLLVVFNLSPGTRNAQLAHLFFPMGASSALVLEPALLPAPLNTHPSLTLRKRAGLVFFPSRDLALLGQEKMDAFVPTGQHHPLHVLYCGETTTMLKKEEKEGDTTTTTGSAKSMQEQKGSTTTTASGVPQAQDTESTLSAIETYFSERFRTNQSVFLVCVHNLSPNTDQATLFKIFYPMGAFNAELYPDIVTFAGKPRRSGVALFHSRDIAAEAAQKINDFVPHGQTRPLVARALTRPDNNNNNEDKRTRQDSRDFASAVSTPTRERAMAALLLRRMSAQSQALPSLVHNTATTNNTSTTTGIVSGRPASPITTPHYAHIVSAAKPTALWCTPASLKGSDTTTTNKDAKRTEGNADDDDEARSMSSPSDEEEGTKGEVKPHIVATTTTTTQSAPDKEEDEDTSAMRSTTKAYLAAVKSALCAPQVAQQTLTAVLYELLSHVAGKDDEEDEKEKEVKEDNGDVKPEAADTKKKEDEEDKEEEKKKDDTTEERVDTKDAQEEGEEGTKRPEVVQCEVGAECEALARVLSRLIVRVLVHKGHHATAIATPLTSALLDVHDQLGVRRRSFNASRDNDPSAAAPLTRSARRAVHILRQIARAMMLLVADAAASREARHVAAVFCAYAFQFPYLPGTPIGFAVMLLRAHREEWRAAKRFLESAADLPSFTNSNSNENDEAQHRPWITLLDSLAEMTTVWRRHNKSRAKRDPFLPEYETYMMEFYGTVATPTGRGAIHGGGRPSGTMAGDATAATTATVLSPPTTRNASLAFLATSIRSSESSPLCEAVSPDDNNSNNNNNNAAGLFATQWLHTTNQLNVTRGTTSTPMAVAGSGRGSPSPPSSVVGPSANYFAHSPANNNPNNHNNYQSMSGGSQSGGSHGLGSSPTPHVIAAPAWLTSAKRSPFTTTTNTSITTGVGGGGLMMSPVVTSNSASGHHTSVAPALVTPSARPTPRRVITRVSPAVVTNTTNNNSNTTPLRGSAAMNATQTANATREKTVEGNPRLSSCAVTPTPPPPAPANQQTQTQTQGQGIWTQPFGPLNTAIPTTFATPTSEQTQGMSADVSLESGASPPPPSLRNTRPAARTHTTTTVVMNSATNSNPSAYAEMEEAAMLSPPAPSTNESTVYVTKIAASLTAGQLRRLLGHFGAVRKVRLYRDDKEGFLPPPPLPSALSSQGTARPNNTTTNTSNGGAVFGLGETGRVSLCYCFVEFTEAAAARAMVEYFRNVLHLPNAFDFLAPTKTTLAAGQEAHRATTTHASGMSLVVSASGATVTLPAASQEEAQTFSTVMYGEAELQMLRCIRASPARSPIHDDGILDAMVRLVSGSTAASTPSSSRVMCVVRPCRFGLWKPATTLLHYNAACQDVSAILMQQHPTGPQPTVRAPPYTADGVNQTVMMMMPRPRPTNAPLSTSVVPGAPSLMALMTMSGPTSAGQGATATTTATGIRPTAPPLALGLAGLNAAPAPHITYTATEEDDDNEDEDDVTTSFNLFNTEDAFFGGAFGVEAAEAAAALDVMSNPTPLTQDAALSAASLSSPLDRIHTRKSAGEKSGTSDGKAIVPPVGAEALQGHRLMSFDLVREGDTTTYTTMKASDIVKDDAVVGGGVWRKETAEKRQEQNLHHVVSRRNEAEDKSRAAPHEPLDQTAKQEESISSAAVVGDEDVDVAETKSEEEEEASMLATMLRNAQLLRNASQPPSQEVTQSLDANPLDWDTAHDALDCSDNSNHDER